MAYLDELRKEGLGARLEFVAVFDEDDHRMPIYLGRVDAA